MQPQFKFFFVEPFDTVLRPFVITTAYTNSGGYVKAEWFLVIPGEKASLFAQVTRFDARSFEGSPVVLDESFMLQEVYEQAQLKLRQYVFEKYQARGLMEFFGTPRFVEAEPKALVHYWLRGECVEQISAIARNTDCQPLQSFLEAIGSLQPIVRRDL